MSKSLTNQFYNFKSYGGAALKVTDGFSWSEQFDDNNNNQSVSCVKYIILGLTTKE